MARIRNVKPDFFKDDELAERLDVATRLFYIGLWTQCDVMGRCEDKPKKLKVEILPYDDVDADAMLTSLSDVGAIERYEVEGKRYLWVRKFRVHQRFGGKEIAEGSKFPPAPGDKLGSNPPPKGATTPHEGRDETEPERDEESQGRDGDAPGTHLGAQGMGEGLGNEYPPNPPSGGTAPKRSRKKAEPEGDKWDTAPNLADFVPPEFGTPEVRKAWADFTQHRKAKRADPYTESGIRKLWTMLERLKYTAPMIPAVIDRCMAEDWKGLPVDVIERFSKAPLQLVEGGKQETEKTPEEIEEETRIRRERLAR